MEMQINKEGLEFYKTKNYKQAIDTFHKLLNIIENKKSSTTNELGICYYNLGSAYYEFGNTNKSVEYLQKSADIYIKLHGSDNPKVIKVLTKIENITQKHNILINTYKIITSNIYNNTPERYMLNEISKVKYFLNEQSDLFQLTDNFKEIHKSLIIEDIIIFDIAKLYCYASFMKIHLSKNYEFYVENKKGKSKLCVEILENKYRHLELLRLNKYIVDVLFNNENDEFFGEFVHYYNPDLKIIKKNGINFYYPNATQSNFYEYLSYFELLHLTAIVNSMYVENEDDHKLFDITCGYNEGELVEVIKIWIETTFQNINNKEDYYITMFGLKVKK